MREFGVVKVRTGFHNFFLAAVLFHLVVFAILNARRVVELDVSEEAFLRFTFIKLPFSTEVEPQLREEIVPQKTEVKVQATVRETTVPKAFKEVEEIKPMDAMQIEERDLLREKLESFMPDNVGVAGIDLPSSFGRSETKTSSLEDHVSKWSGEASSDDGTGGFGGKKNVQRYSYGQVAFKQFISRLPDWVEKSDKVIITTVRVWIHPDGVVVKAEVVKSSGYLELDQLALDSIKKRNFKPSNEDAERVAIIEIDFTNIR